MNLHTLFLVALIAVTFPTSGTAVSIMCVYQNSYFVFGRKNKAQQTAKDTIPTVILHLYFHLFLSSIQAVMSIVFWEGIQYRIQNHSTVCTSVSVLGNNFSLIFSPFKNAGNVADHRHISLKTAVTDKFKIFLPRGGKRHCRTTSKLKQGLLGVSKFKQSLMTGYHTLNSKECGQLYPTMRNLTEEQSES